MIAANVGGLFPGAQIAATALFRITRDADVSVERDETDDLLEAVERAVLTRQRRPPVRLQVSPAADPRIRAWLDELVKLQPEEVYEMDSTLDGAALMELANWPGFEQLKNVEWPPQPPRDLLGSDDLFETLADHDVLLFHPYETLRAGGALDRAGGRRSQRAGHQADALSHQRQFAHRPRLGPGGAKRQGSDRAGRVAGPLRRGPQHPVGPPPGRPRRPT